VVAVDADPVMVEACRDRFVGEIKSGKLTILNVGIAAKRERLCFWLHKRNRPWSSFHRNPEWPDEDCEMVEVQCVPFREIIAEYGVPFYLKVDIEGADGLCLAALTPDDLPKYLSFEAGPLSLYGVCFLATLGYNAFKLIDQTAHNRTQERYSNEDLVRRWRREALVWKWSVTRKWSLDTTVFAKMWRGARKAIASAPVVDQSSGVWRFGPHSSGPFGEETPGKWSSLEEVAYNWLHRRFHQTNRGTLNQTSWYDWHATMIEGYPGCESFCGRNLTSPLIA
jgi:FkbM family methyltransferase